MSGSRAVHVFLAYALLNCAFSASVFAQQSGQAPPVRVGNPTHLNFPAISKSHSAPPEIEHLPDLAARLLRHAADADCHPGDCKILVTDFVFPDGLTFPNGIKWADDLSSLFADQQKSIQVADRILFKDFLERERISARLQNSEPVARGLASHFNATVVLVGQARMIKEDVVQLSARFLSVNHSDLIGPSSEVNLLVDQAPAGLDPTDGLLPRPPLPPLPGTMNGEGVYQGGVQGSGLPSCYYMPSPPYTEDARSTQFSGIIIVEGVVGSDGAVRAVRIVKGAPFGLDESVVKTVSTWMGKPAMLDGKPVATVVPLEMNFRLYRAN
jgi:TonB family protein